MKGPPVFRVDVLNFALVTYRVPAERVLRHLPEHYELDTVDGPSGSEAFVSATCFCNQGFRGALVGYPRHTFNESTYRTYVTRDGEKGVYFFGRYLGTHLAWSLQRPVARHTYEGDFELNIETRSGTFPTYDCKVSSPSGDTNFSIQATDHPPSIPPFETGNDLAQFFTYRLHGFYTNTGGFQSHMPIEHPRMAPSAGSLLHGRFDLWNELDIVRPSEVQDPYSVLVVSDIPFTLFAPRPIPARDKAAI